MKCSRGILKAVIFIFLIDYLQFEPVMLCLLKILILGFIVDHYRKGLDGTPITAAVAPVGAPAKNNKLPQCLRLQNGSL